MPGVSKTCCFGAAMLLAVTGLVGKQAKAEEFGNIIVPSVEDRSRQASAQALGAAAQVLKGFQSRELRQSSAEKEAFAIAVNDLRAAGKQMDLILQQATGSPELQKVLNTSFNFEKDISQRDRDAFAFWVSRFKRKPDEIKTRGEVFALFAQDTMRFADTVEGGIGQRDRTVFRRVTDDLSLYLRMGDVVAVVMRGS